MSEFKCSRGHVVTWNHDQQTMSWTDPAAGAVEPTLENEAGDIRFPIDLGANPEIREDHEGNLIVADRFKMKWLGQPFIWGLWDLETNRPAEYPA